MIHYATSGGPQQRPTAVPEGSSKPRIISTDIRSVTAHAETDAYLPCVAVGKPSPFLSWTKVSTGRERYGLSLFNSITIMFSVLCRHMHVEIYSVDSVLKLSLFSCRGKSNTEYQGSKI